MEVKMDNKIIIKLKKILKILIPDNNADVYSLADLTNNPDPAIRELCETADLINRLSKREGS